MAVAIHRLLTDNDLHAELREKGLQRAHCFSWELAARKTLEVYRHVRTAQTRISPPRATASPRQINRL
jgi:hypothetical protein